MISGRRFEMIVGVAIAVAIVVPPLRDRLTPHAPVQSLRTLEGCYEGEGLPDFLRSSRHWNFRIANGSLFGREELVVSHIRLIKIGNHETAVVFSPGILIVGKPATAMVGVSRIGNVFLRRGRVIFSFADELWLKTNCS